MQNEDSTTINPANTFKALPKVLLVEDNVDNKDLTIIYLKDICSIDDAPTGEIGLEMVRKNLYNLILMDIHLGDGIDGWETTRQIRVIPEYATIPIIALTGYSLNYSMEELKLKGITHFLTKPINKKTLCDLVQSLLQSI